MMEKVVITAGDILTSLGDLQNTWEKMLVGRTGLHFQQEFAPDMASVPQPTQSPYRLGLIEGLQGTGGSWQRLQSLLSNLLSSVPVVPENTPLFVATTKAAVDELLAAGNTKNGQPWQLADYLKEKMQLTGQATTVSAACASGTIAIIQASMAIATGRCEHALVVGVDLVADFILAGFESLKALSPDVVRPFDRSRNGLSLGDGGGWVLLSSAKTAVHLSATPLAVLEGWGISCDATHITAPCRKASGLKMALDQVLGGLDNREIQPGGINAHGTGTVYNDAMELLAFSEKVSSRVPVCSVKGAIGHTLGAAGVIEAMLSVKSLQEMVLPPTVGLLEPEGSGQNLSGHDALPLQAPSIVSCNSGFGGINAAVLLSSEHLVSR